MNIPRINEPAVVNELIQQFDQAMCQLWLRQVALDSNPHIRNVCFLVQIRIIFVEFSLKHVRNDPRGSLFYLKY